MHIDKYRAYKYTMHKYFFYLLLEKECIRFVHIKLLCFIVISLLVVTNIVAKTQIYAKVIMPYTFSTSANRVHIFQDSKSKGTVSLGWGLFEL